MDTNLEQAQSLSQALLDFVLDAEGEIASALEAFTAEKLKTLSNGLFRDSAQIDAAVEMFAMQESVGGRSVLEWFLEDGDFSESDQALVRSWSRSFIGLFAVEQKTAELYTLRNWLTDKTYTVQASQNPAELDAMKRIGPGDIVLTRILPMDEQWMFSGPKGLLGKLGKPKLAVAIGNFKDHHKDSLYADAPELLDAAWFSVEVGHQTFIDFFGSEEVTLPSHQLSQKLTDYQTAATQAQLKSAGIGEGASLKDLMSQVGLDTEELASELPAGVSEKMVSQALEKASSPNMVAPPIEIPIHLKQAESVTVLAHPRWGQVFLTDYESVKKILADQSAQTASGNLEEDNKKIHQLLENPEAKAFVWQRLAQEYPEQLEQTLRRVFARSDFKMNRDLEPLLKEFNKSLIPNLPETASVPQHLHDLFQAAFSEVHRSQSKDRAKGPAQKKSGGFGR